MNDLVSQCAGKNDKENSSSCKIDCKAMVRLLRTKDHGWYVSMFVKEHNHRLSVGYDAKLQWNSHDSIDPISFDFIKNLRSNNVSVGKVYNILCGAEWNSQAVPYRKQVLRTLCAKFSQDTIKDDLTKTMKLLQEMKIEDTNLKVEIDVDGDGRVRTMLWVTGKNRQDYYHFGDVVTFDTTYKTNLYNMPFALFVGVNNHFQSVIFGGALMREETEAAFNWLFKTFVALMNDKHPVTILTDQALAMKGAIESALPNTKHRWCKWHVLHDVKGNIGHVYNKSFGFKKEFNKLVNDVMCVDEFESKWLSLVRRFNVSDNEYMVRLYDKRAMWAKPYFKGIFCAGMTSTQRSESANHMLKQYTPRSSPMHVFVRQYNKFLGSRRNDEAREFHLNANKSRTYESTYPIEDDAASIYTRSILLKFQDELYKCGSYVVTPVVHGAHYMVSVALSKVKDATNRKWRNVKVDDDGQFIYCDCGMFDHVGMLCRHALKVMIREDFLKIPSKNILKRWTIWATGTYPAGMDMSDNGPHTDNTSYLKNILHIAVEDLMKARSHDKESLEAAVEGMGKLTAAIRKNNSVTETNHRLEPPHVESFVNIHVNTILAPERVKKSGRPASARPKSKMDHAATAAKKKNKSNKTTKKKPCGELKPRERGLPSLYDNDQSTDTPSKEMEDEISPNIPSKKRKVDIG